MAFRVYDTSHVELMMLIIGRKCDFRENCVLIIIIIIIVIHEYD